jgi:hypothetical protein
MITVTNEGDSAVDADSLVVISSGETDACSAGASRAGGGARRRAV